MQQDKLGTVVAGMDRCHGTWLYRGHARRVAGLRGVHRLCRTSRLGSCSCRRRRRVSPSAALSGWSCAAATSQPAGGGGMLASLRRRHPWAGPRRGRGRSPCAIRRPPTRPRSRCSHGSVQIALTTQAPAVFLALRWVPPVWLALRGQHGLSAVDRRQWPCWSAARIVAAVLAPDLRLRDGRWWASRRTIPHTRPVSPAPVWQNESGQVLLTVRITGNF